MYRQRLQWAAMSSQVAPAPDPKAARAKVLVVRVDDITQSAQAAWITYLGVLGFSLLAVLGIRDVDLFANVATTTLPVIDFEVRLSAFMSLAPLILTLNFGYLHGFVDQAWRPLGELPARSGEEPVAVELKPWLVVEFALYVRRMLRRNREAHCVEISVLGGMGVLFIAVFHWAGAPFVVATFWWRSLVLHDVWWSLFLVFLVWVNIVIAVLSLLSVARAMKAPVT